MKSFCQVIVASALLTMSIRGFAVTPAEPPLPTLEEVFSRMTDRARLESENDRSFESQFSFVRSRVTEHRNSKGEIKKQESKFSTNNPALKKRVAEPAAVPGHAHEKAQPGTNSASTARGKAVKKDVFSVNDDLIKRFQFTLVGREKFNGRPALVLEFEPAKEKQPERSLGDKFINRTAGRVWLDEEDYAMAKVTLRLTKRVNVVGGLVGAVWKFNFGFERERTEEGLWFARETTWHLEGREVFDKRTLDYREVRTDVRKAQ